MNASVYAGPGVYSIAIQTQWDSVHTGPDGSRVLVVSHAHHLDLGQPLYSGQTVYRIGV